MKLNKPFILGVTAASSGAGKTTLIEKIIPALIKENIRVSVVKHGHHSFEIDYPGKDSYRLRKAGAYQTLVLNDKRSALITEYAENPHSFESSIQQMDKDVDVILVEGLRQSHYKKIEVLRKDHSDDKLFLKDPNIIAVITDGSFSAPIPIININDTQAITHFIITTLKNA
jgi:molybdopterin-guanine dinucleotide biosynthesis protein MobB